MWPNRQNVYQIANFFGLNRGRLLGPGMHSVVDLDIIYGIRANTRKLDASSCWRRGHEGWWYYSTMDRGPDVGTRSLPILSYLTMARFIEYDPGLQAVCLDLTRTSGV